MGEAPSAQLLERFIHLWPRDIRCRATIRVDVEPPRGALTASSTLEEWLADPDGRAAITAAIGVDQHGRPNGILGDEELRTVIGNFPLSALAAFPGLGITHELIRQLVTR